MSPAPLRSQTVRSNHDLGGLDPDFVLRFIIYMYDPQSPALLNIPDLTKRKAWVANELGVDLSNIPSDINDMMLFRNKGANRRAVTFMLITGGENFMVWQKSLNELVAVTSVPIKLDSTDVNEQNKIVATQKTLGDIQSKVLAQIKDSKTAFLLGEKSKELEDELISFTLQNSMGIRPEEYIDVFEKDGDIFPESEI